MIRLGRGGTPPVAAQLDYRGLSVAADPGPPPTYEEAYPSAGPGNTTRMSTRTARVGACCPEGMLGHQIIQVRPRTRGASAEGGQDMSNGRESDQQLRSAMAELAGNFHSTAPMAPMKP